MSDGHHPTERLPNAVEQFIIAHIASVDLLEMLMLLHGQPQRKWSPQEIGVELRTNTFAGQNGLVRLCAMGAATSDSEGFRYQPASPEIDSVVDQLEHVYLHRRVAVMTNDALSELEWDPALCAKEITVATDKGVVT